MDTTKADQNQFLNDINPDTKKKVKWDRKKEQSQAVALAFKDLEDRDNAIDGIAMKMLICGDYLEFWKYTNGQMKLNRANFCRQRLCPMCAWRRSLKLFGQITQMMQVLRDRKKYTFLFLTLTIKNPVAKDLSKTLNQMYAGFNLFRKRKEFKKAVTGWVRTLEVTHNVNKKSKSFKTYHPHFHMILVVPRSYFKGSVYLSQKKWAGLWQESLNVDYEPLVNIQKVKKGSGSIREISKYAVKPSDIILEDYELMLDGIYTLHNALKSRRLVGFGGIFRTLRKELQLEDVETGDLINTDQDQDIDPDLDYIVQKYSWHLGYNRYTKI